METLWSLTLRAAVARDRDPSITPDTSLQRSLKVRA